MDALLDEAFELTDPATELAGLVERLQSAPAETNGIRAFAKVMQVEPANSLFLELLSIVRQRIAFVERCIPEFREQLGQQLANDVVVAVRACTHIVSIDRLIGLWDPKTKLVSDAQIGSLRWFGNMAMRKSYPLMVISETQRKDALRKVTQEIASLGALEDFGWQKIALIEGLEKI